MNLREKFVAAISLFVGIHAPISTACAMTIEALCAQDYVASEVVRFSKTLRYPSDAGRMKPDIANFDKKAGPMSCIFGLTAGNVYDFGNYKATFKDLGYNQVRVISLTPVD